MKDTIEKRKIEFALARHLIHMDKPGARILELEKLATYGDGSFLVGYVVAWDTMDEAHEERQVAYMLGSDLVVRGMKAE